VVSNSDSRWDAWTFPTVLLWLVFFFAGLDPETLYERLRELGLVVTQNAIVNSPYVVSLVFAGYIGLFAYHRCIESGLSKIDAKARGLQIGIIGLMAFLSFSPAMVTLVGEIPERRYQTVVMIVAFAKLFAWFYLLILILRYYMLGHNHVFARISSAFPSTYRGADEPVELGQATTVAWLDRPDRGEAAPAGDSRPASADTASGSAAPGTE
jgi:hypothetical protein